VSEHAKFKQIVKLVKYYASAAGGKRTAAKITAAITKTARPAIFHEMAFILIL
jgi:hypothetical protein